MKSIIKWRECAAKFPCSTLALIVTCLAQTACSVAPGMRMQESSSHTVTGTDVATPVPITEVDAKLLQQLRQEDAALANSGSELAQTGRTGSYTLAPGDVLQITVWDHPELAQAIGPLSAANPRASDPVQGFVIDQDGKLRFPFAGTLHAQGLTPVDIRKQLVSALSLSFRDPQVTVRVASYRAKQVFIDGEVRAPGALSLNDIPMTLYDAISRSGGFSTSADQSRMTLVRKGKSYPLDLSAMIARGENPSNIVLVNGDLLRVGTRDDFGAYVMGEVNKPVTAIPPKSGRLTLSDALSQAGSVNPNTSNPAQLYVIRAMPDATARVFHLDAASPVSMVLANDFVLHPKDVVYVDGSGLVRFSRVLSLLLPAINSGLTAAVLTR